MEPITMAMLTAALIELGKKAAEGAAGKAGEAAVEQAMTYWTKVKEMLGLKGDPAPTELEAAVKRAVENRPAVAAELQGVVNQYQTMSGQSLIGSAHVDKGVVNAVGHNAGTMNTTLTFNGD